MSDPKNVLITLHRGYGLGDAVQMSVVLRHVTKYRPNWKVDYQAEEGKHQVGWGIVYNTFASGSSYPSPHYDAEVLITLYDTWEAWTDRPNTHVSTCLRNHFGMEWDRDLGHYQVNVSRTAHDRVKEFLLGGHWVAIHYQGDTLQDKKNLTHEQASEVCQKIWDLGYSPLILDFRRQSRLHNHVVKLSSPHHWGGNAEYNCAIISQCKAFIGIDSGPAKCASATNTPSLVVWTGHHPAQFHDPSPNTTHLVPANYHSLHPVCNNQRVVGWFEDNYNTIHYEGDPVNKIGRWLKEVLK